MHRLLRECVPVTPDVIEHVILPMCLSPHPARVDCEPDNFLITNTLTGHRARLTLSGYDLQLIGETVHKNSGKTLMYLGGTTFATLANDDGVYSYVASMFTIIVSKKFTFKLHSLPNWLLMPCHRVGHGVYFIEVLYSQHIVLDVGGTDPRLILGTDPMSASYNYLYWPQGFHAL